MTGLSDRGAKNKSPSGYMINWHRIRISYNKDGSEHHFGIHPQDTNFRQQLWKPPAAAMNLPDRKRAAPNHELVVIIIISSDAHFGAIGSANC